MGRPISSNYFGAGVGKVAITFHNGTSVVNGYILRQSGTRQYVATVDGVTGFVVHLASTTAVATALTAGMATIKMVDSSGTTKYVQKLMGTTCIDTTGVVSSWSTASAVGTTLKIGIIVAPTSGMSVNTIANQVHAVQFTVTGTYTGTAPGVLQVKVGNGSYVNTTTPTVSNGTFSFPITIPSAATGTTISVRDFTNSVAGVTATSVAFDVT